MNHGRRANNAETAVAQAVTHGKLEAVQKTQNVTYFAARSCPEYAFKLTIHAVLEPAVTTSGEPLLWI